MSAATMNEMERLKRVNAEWGQLFQPLFDYVDQNHLAKLGQSRVKALIDAHEYTAAQLNAALEREKQAQHETKCLAEVIQSAAVKAGIVNASTPLTGPMLMLICNDVSDALTDTLEREAALATHMERLHSALIQEREFKYIREGMRSAQAKIHAESNTPHINPCISLTRRDLIKQAELLEYMGEEVKSMHPKANKDGIAAHLTHVSRECRQRASEL